MYTHVATVFKPYKVMYQYISYTIILHTAICSDLAKFCTTIIHTHPQPLRVQAALFARLLQIAVHYDALECHNSTKVSLYLVDMAATSTDEGIPGWRKG